MQISYAKNIIPLLIVLLIITTMLVLQAMKVVGDYQNHVDDYHL